MKIRIALVAVSALSLLAVGCSSSSTTTTTVAPTTTTTVADDPAVSGAITFVRTFVPDESLFAAEGEAVDLGLLCATATGEEVGEEDVDGNALTEAESDALFNGTESFIAVTVEEMTCDDGSGSFALRMAVGVDPTDPNWGPETAEVTWTITGGTGYEATTGEGEDTEFAFVDGADVATASGSITSSG